MISQEKWMILTSLQKMPNNVGDLGKIIIATGIEWLPRVQKIAQSGHTDHISDKTNTCTIYNINWSYWTRAVPKHFEITYIGS